MQLPLEQSHRHNRTHTKLRIFKISIFDERFLLIRYLIDPNKEFTDDKTKKFDSKLDKRADKLDEIIALVKI